MLLKQGWLRSLKAESANYEAEAKLGLGTKLRITQTLKLALWFSLGASLNSKMIGASTLHEARFGPLAWPLHGPDTSRS